MKRRNKQRKKQVNITITEAQNIFVTLVMKAKYADQRGNF